MFSSSSSSTISSPSLPSSLEFAVPVDEVKRSLFNFSPQLRRDFLAILVKMTAKEFNLVTVRKDSRTKDGMLKFLAKHWLLLKPQLYHDTAIHWFVSIFSMTEFIFSDRQFALFIYNNWSVYKQTLIRQDIIQFMKYSQKFLKQILKSRELIQIPSEWKNFHVSLDFLKIISDYFHQTTRIPEDNQPKALEEPRLATNGEEHFSQGPFSPFEESFPMNLDFEFVVDEDFLNPPSLWDE